MVVLPTSLALLVSACGTSPVAASDTAGAASAVIRVVAAENFWGSIAAQLGGSRVAVTSIITNPDTDPHSYEPTPADAVRVARSRLVIVNGVGYDPWLPRLLAADDGRRSVLDVGALVGAPDGANPHRWYNPADVRRVISRITADYEAIDPADRSLFASREASFESVDLGPYDTTVAAIRARYSGTAVGASESIFAMLAPALGLDLVTPPGFLRAISEGTDVSAADKATADRQISAHRIRIYVYNSQNVTPDVRAQLAEVRAAGIPAVTITETLTPPGTTYQAWQTRQLLAIQAALARAAAR